jgi:hypothetical protein
MQYNTSAYSWNSDSAYFLTSLLTYQAHYYVKLSLLAAFFRLSPLLILISIFFLTAPWHFYLPSTIRLPADQLRLLFAAAKFNQTLWTSTSLAFCILPFLDLQLPKLLLLNLTSIINSHLWTHTITSTGTKQRPPFCRTPLVDLLICSWDTPLNLPTSSTSKSILQLAFPPHLHLS